MERLRALERSPVGHNGSALIRIIHFIIGVVVLTLSNMQHADGTEEEQRGTSEMSQARRGNDGKNKSQ